MNRIDRLSAILIMLQSSQSVKPKRIVERFDIGIRTVYRDIGALEEAGIPITGNSKIGYSLVEGFKLPPLMFTQEEAFAFLTAEKLVDKFTDSGIKESYRSGIDKIRAVMRVAEKETVTSMDNKIGMLDFHAPIIADSHNCLHLLMDGIVKQNKVELTYFSYSKNETTVRLIDPIGVFFSMANWYCVGFCNQKKDYRTFKVSRIQNINHTTLPVDKIHPSLDSFLQKLGIQPDLQKVVIEVKRNDLPIIDESKYYQGLITEKPRKDIIELHFMVFSLDHFARWYMSYIDIAKINTPQSLSDMVNALLSKAQLLGLPFKA